MTPVAVYGRYSSSSPFDTALLSSGELGNESASIEESIKSLKREDSFNLKRPQAMINSEDLKDSLITSNTPKSRSGKVRVLAGRVTKTHCKKNISSHSLMSVQTRLFSKSKVKNGNVKQENVNKTPSALRQMRTQNLAKKSSSTLLLDLLLHRPSQQMEEIQKIVLSDSRRTKMNNKRRKKRVSISQMGVNCHAQTQKSLDGYIANADSSLLSMISYFLSMGADPNIRDADGNDPLLIALQYAKNEDVLKVLLEHGATPSYIFTSTNERCTHLDIAIQLREEKSVKILLEKSCLPTQFSAPSTERPEEICLIDFARVNDFLDLALNTLEEGFLTAMTNLDWPTMRDCLAHGFDINTRDKAGKTPLFHATEWKELCVDLIEFLLKNGANVNISAFDGRFLCFYPLFRHSTNTNSFKVLKLLCDYGLDWNQMVLGLDEDCDVPLRELAQQLVVRKDVLDYINRSVSKQSK